MRGISSLFITEESSKKQCQWMFENGIAKFPETANVIHMWTESRTWILKSVEEHRKAGLNYLISAGKWWDLPEDIYTGYRRTFVEDLRWHLETGNLPSQDRMMVYITYEFMVDYTYGQPWKTYHTDVAKMFVDCINTAYSEGFPLTVLWSPCIVYDMTSPTLLYTRYNQFLAKIVKGVYLKRRPNLMLVSAIVDGVGGAAPWGQDRTPGTKGHKRILKLLKAHHKACRVNKVVPRVNAELFSMTADGAMSPGPLERIQQQVDSEYQYSDYGMGPCFCAGWFTEMPQGRRLSWKKLSQLESTRFLGF